MTLEEAIIARHSVRDYISKPLPEDVVLTLQKAIDECNREGDLHFQLILNEKKAFTGMLAYGKFKGVENYLVFAGKKAPDLDDRVGYYGEKIVLLAQTLGLNTCWVGLSYRNVKNAYDIAEGEKLACMVSLGYGRTQGPLSKSKKITDVSNYSTTSPDWFRKGVEAALLAPTAINQQKFYFELTDKKRDGKAVVRAKRIFSAVGYTHMDMGIAKLHFEIGAGTENFVWDE